MNDLEPIEIEFAVKNNELMQEFNKMIASSNAFDKSIDQTKQKFNEFVNSQLKANGVLTENASLTDRQTNALKRHYEALEYLKEQIAKTTDPTQLGVYNYQLKQAEQAITDIVKAANTKVELLNSAELEEQNRKLEQAGRTLDLIADKSFEFANPQELEVLSRAINEAGNEMEQLGIVVDFVSAKMNSSDMEPQLLVSLKEDIQAANDMLGRTPVIYETAGNSINELTDALKYYQIQLSQTTNPEDAVAINKNIESIETAIKSLQNAGKTGFDEFGTKIEEQKPKTEMLRTELQKLIQNMSELRLENKANSEEYARLRDRATEIRSALSLINQEVNSGASSTGGLDTLIRVTSSISAGFALAQGSAALFGKTQEDVARTIQKVTGAMAVLQAMQQIQAELKRNDSLVTKAQTAYQAMYARVVGQSTGALKTFRIALAATGIGLFIILLAELVTNWDKVKRAIGLTTDEMERNQAITKKANDLYGDQVGKIRMLVELNKQEGLTTRQKQNAVKDFNKEFGNTLGSVKDYAELERRIIANAPKYIEYLTVKAQAEAAYILSLEKQKTLLEQITALSTGDLKWYQQIGDSIGNATQKMSNKFWSLFGVETNEVQKSISQDEILRIVGLPTEEEQEKALGNYDARIRKRLQNIISQHAKDADMTSLTLKLQQEAAKIADEMGIKEDENKPKANNILKERLGVLDAIAKAERDYLKNSMSGLDKELEDIKQKYAQLRAEAEKVKLSANEIKRINDLETKEIGLATYKDNTDQLIQQLEKEKELYKLYEEAKTLIGAEEITKRYEDQLTDFKTFGERLQAEIAQIEQTPEADRSGAEAERLNKLLEFQRVYEKEVQELQDDRYLNAYEKALTLQERIAMIEADYRTQRIELEKIADETLRDEKLKVLKQQKKDAVLSVETEIYEKGLKERQLIKELTAYTKKELKNRLKSTQEYLTEYSEFLSEDQKLHLESEVKLLNSIIGATDHISKQNALLKEKERITKAIKNNTSKDPEVAKRLNAELEDVNFLISENDKGVLSLNDSIEIAVQTARGLADAFGSSNEELQRSVNTISNLVTSISQGNMAGAVLTVVDWLIQGFKDVFGKNREAERQRNSERLRNQEEYNRMLREQLLLEIRLNDEYQSRVQAVKEEQDALLKNRESVVDRMKTILSIFNSIYSDLGKSAAVFDLAQHFAWEKLGLNEYFKDGVELSDELLNKLVQLNAVAPLEGQFKELYEELMRLRDEYGSIEAAMRELQKEMINNLTGTTAKSLADSIREGIASGKRSFADFADDIEGFLRNAILAGMSTKILEPQMQALQDMLYEMMGDGVMTEEERQRFQEMYMKIVNEANAYMDMINQAGIDIAGGNQQNSLKGAIKGITEEQADLLAGQFGGLRLAQLETNQILRSSAAYQMQACSEMIALQTQIELNTRYTADRLKLIYEYISGTSGTLTSTTNSLTANGF